MDPSRMSFIERVVYLKTWSTAFRRLIKALPDWITPNRVTLFRAALSVPLFAALADGRYWTAAAVFAAAMALDAVDGAIAHVKDMHTPAGAFLDPLADKLILCAAVAAVWRLLPGWILLLVGGSVVFAAAITVVRIVRLVDARRLSGPALARSVAAKPAGKVKTIFDVLAATLVIAGLGLGSESVVDAGGGLLVIGTVLAACVHFFRDGRAQASAPAHPENRPSRPRAVA